jgi:hypothetical protein
MCLTKKIIFFIDSKSKPFTVVFNHRGEFVKENNTVIYRTGVQTLVTSETVDEWNMSYLRKLVMGWGMN